LNPRLYAQGKNQLYPLYRRLGGPQSRSESGGEEINSYPIPALEPSTIKPVAQRYTTELSRFSASLINVIKYVAGNGKTHAQIGFFMIML
jgi:hypothetical protein